MEVIGSANLDLVVEIPRLPAPGETVGQGTLRRGPGGKGLNQAVAAARFGATTRFIGCVGDDAEGLALLAFLEAEGVATDEVQRMALATGTAVVLVDAAGENLIAVAPGANAALDGTRAMATPPDVLLAQLEVPLMAVAARARAVRPHGTQVVLNVAPAPFDARGLEALADVLVGNETEARTLTGVEDPVVAAERLTDLAATVVVTLGARGALAVGPGGLVRVPAPRIESVDTVGAGDAFCGVLAAALAQGRDLGSALSTACAAGALTATRRGAAAAMPTRAEVEQLAGTVQP